MARKVEFMTTYIPLVVVSLLVIAGILWLWSRRKVTAAEPTKAKSKTRTKRVEEEEIDPDSVQPTKRATFFPDKPSLRDYLDFKSYAIPLADLIAQETTQTPLTVGLFGAWGSGKTTLMRMIEKSLKVIQKEPDSIKFVLVGFDAWKYYKEDALWRALLLRVLDALRIEAEENSNEELLSEIEHLEQSL